jgi:hypothetical protein
MALNLLKPNKIRARTARLREKFEAAGLPISPPENTVKSDRLAVVIRDGEFGCRTESVYKLVEAILDINIPRLSSESDSVEKPTKKGSLVVFAGRTYLITGFDGDGDMMGFDSNMSSVFVDGETHANFLQPTDDYRPATHSEVEWFLVEAGVTKPEPETPPA